MHTARRDRDVGRVSRLLQLPRRHANMGGARLLENEPHPKFVDRMLIERDTPLPAKQLVPGQNKFRLPVYISEISLVFPLDQPYPFVISRLVQRWQSTRLEKVLPHSYAYTTSAIFVDNLLYTPFPVL